MWVRFCARSGSKLFTGFVVREKWAGKMFVSMRKAQALADEVRRGNGC